MPLALADPNATSFVSADFLKGFDAESMPGFYSTGLSSTLLVFEIGFLISRSGLEN